MTFSDSELDVSGKRYAAILPPDLFPQGFFTFPGSPTHWTFYRHNRWPFGVFPSPGSDRWYGDRFGWYVNLFGTGWCPFFTCTSWNFLRNTQQQRSFQQVFTQKALALHSKHGSLSYPTHFGMVRHFSNWRSFSAALVWRVSTFGLDWVSTYDPIEVGPLEQKA